MKVHFRSFHELQRKTIFQISLKKIDWCIIRREILSRNHFETINKTSQINQDISRKKTRRAVNNKT